MNRVLVEEEDLPRGGFFKNHRPTGPPEEERRGKHKTPRRPRDPLEELSLVTVLKEPWTTEVAQEKNEEVKEMETDVTQVKTRKVPFTVIGFEICPICGRYSKHVVLDGKPYIACKGCDDKYYAYKKECDEKYRIYADQVAVEIAADKNPVVLPKVVLPKFEWFLAQLDIESIEKELVEARLMMEIHNGRYLRRAERIKERVRAKANGKTLSQEVLVSLENLYRKELTEEDSKTARKDTDLVRYLNTWLIAAKKLKSELEQKIAEAAQKTAEVIASNAAETVPETPAPAPTTPTALLVIPEPVAVT